MRRVRICVTGALPRRWFTVGGVSSAAIPQGMRAFALRDSAETVETIAEAYVNMDLTTMRAFHELVVRGMAQPPGTDPLPYEAALLSGMGGGSNSVAPAAKSATPAETSTPPAAAQAKKTAEKTAFDVIIKKYPAANKVKLIKELRGVSGLPLQEAKAAVEKCPGVVVRAMARDDAEKLKRLFEGHDAEVELV